MNTNEVDEFLKDLNGEDSNNDFKENQDPFNLDPQVEEEKEEEVKEEEKPLPFHKDPKVLRFIEKEIAKRTPKEEEKFKNDVKEEEDDYYVRLIGNDTPEKLAMIREARQRDERLLQQAEERAFNRLSQKEQEKLQADRQAEEQLDNALDDIEETFNVDITSNNPVAKKTRVDFMKFVEKIAPKDRNGDIIDYPDMNSAFETFQEMRKTAPDSSRAKSLASRSQVRSSDTIIKPQERATFDNADSFIDKLFNRT